MTSHLTISDICSVIGQNVFFHGTPFQRKHRYLQCSWIKAPTHSRKGICYFRVLKIGLLSLYISLKELFSLKQVAKFQNEGRLWCWIKSDMCPCFGKDSTHERYGFCEDLHRHFPPHLSCSSEPLKKSTFHSFPLPANFFPFFPIFVIWA